MYVCLYGCMYVWLHEYVWMRACVCVYTDRERGARNLWDRRIERPGNRGEESGRTDTCAIAHAARFARRAVNPALGEKVLWEGEPRRRTKFHPGAAADRPPAPQFGFSPATSRGSDPWRNVLPLFEERESPGAPRAAPWDIRQHIRRDEPIAPGIAANLWPIFNLMNTHG